jgi:D-sedoheptulose 7-phosphate isomerase
MSKNNYKDLVDNSFKEHSETLKETHSKLSNNIELSSDLIFSSIKAGGTIFWCGNGGSAADSQHLAAEFVGRYKKDRQPLRSLALTTDTSVLTCISNDYSYKEIFSRQIEALGREGDVLIAISTSGNSNNVKEALIKAKSIGIKTIGLLGRNGGVCKNYTDLTLLVPSDTTARIQEMHILIGHLLCEMTEKKLGLN